MGTETACAAYPAVDVSGVGVGGFLGGDMPGDLLFERQYKAEMLAWGHVRKCRAGDLMVLVGDETAIGMLLEPNIAQGNGHAGCLRDEAEMRLLLRDGRVLAFNPNGNLLADYPVERIKSLSPNINTGASLHAYAVMASGYGSYEHPIAAFASCYSVVSASKGGRLVHSCRSMSHREI